MAPPERPLATLPALKALAACVREDPPEELRKCIVAALEADEDLLSLAAQHHLLSLLSIRIREAGLQSVLPEGQWAAISHEHAVLAHHQTHTFAGALEVLELLEAAGIAPVLPVKGLALASLIWPELLPRRLADIDFLVAAGQVERAQQALCGAGFVPFIAAPEPYLLHFHAPTLGRAGVRVELHHGLWQSASLPFGLPDLDGLAARSVWAAVQGRPIRVPCPEDAVILLAGVLARDRFSVPLGQWADLYWLTVLCQSGVDPKRLRSLAGALGMRGLVNVVLRFAQEVFGSRLLPDSEWDSVCASAYGRLEPVLWRRLVADAGSAEQHAALFDWLASRRQGRAREEEGASPGQAVASGPDSSPGPWSRLRSFGGPVRAAVKAGGYAGRLVTSRVWRQEFREEITIRRVLGALSEARRD